VLTEQGRQIREVTGAVAELREHSVPCMMQSQQISDLEGQLAELRATQRQQADELRALVVLATQMAGNVQDLASAQAETSKVCAELQLGLSELARRTSRDELLVARAERQPTLTVEVLGTLGQEHPHSSDASGTACQTPAFDAAVVESAGNGRSWSGQGGGVPEHPNSEHEGGRGALDRLVALLSHHTGRPEDGIRDRLDGAPGPLLLQALSICQWDLDDEIAADTADKVLSSGRALPPCALQVLKASWGELQQRRLTCNRTEWLSHARAFVDGRNRLLQA
jgi:hypothetical protein